MPRASDSPAREQVPWFVAATPSHFDFSSTRLRKVPLHDASRGPKLGQEAVWASIDSQPAAWDGFACAPNLCLSTKSRRGRPWYPADAAARVPHTLARALGGNAAEGASPCFVS
ncbi:hypothetical protein MRX96_009258 [Rhipicephalus microplus]